MSDNIPFEIQAEILKRLPIKSLIRFRSVSKPWKSLIGSAEFIADFNLNHTEPQHLFVSYNNNNKEQKYVSILDDDSFPQQKFPLTPPISCNINEPYDAKIIGSSKGLFCLLPYDHDPYIWPTTNTAVIWNPSVRKSVFIPVPNMLPCRYKTVIGCGVCPYTNQPKLFLYISKHNRKLDTIRLEVYSCKSRVWRSISNTLPRETIVLSSEHVAIGRFIYFIGSDRNIEYEGIEDQYYGIKYEYNLILLFDITNEEFTEEINLPDGLQGAGDLLQKNIHVSESRDSLIILKTDVYGEHVWMLENGVSKSFTKLYTIATPYASIKSVLGFTKSGEPIVHMMPRYDERNGIYVYDPVTQQFNYIWITGNLFTYFASSYVESLLLLDY